MSDALIAPIYGDTQYLRSRGGRRLMSIAYTESGVFIAPTTHFRVWVFGGGGSGGAACALLIGGSSVAMHAGASGGGAGGTAIKDVRCNVGSTFTVAIGAGGASVNGSLSIYSSANASNNGTKQAQGNNGGDSRFTGPGVDIVASGGRGGQSYAVIGLSSSASASVAAGLGGAGSGGDWNFTGGSGGAISLSGSNTRQSDATGGGAPGIISNGNGSMNAAGASAGRLGLVGGVDFRKTTSGYYASSSSQSYTIPYSYDRIPGIAGVGFFQDGYSSGSYASYSSVPGGDFAGSTGSTSATSTTNIGGTTYYNKSYKFFGEGPLAGGGGAQAFNGSTSVTMNYSSTIAASLASASGGNGVVIIEVFDD